jgi:heme-degrading monooxygenase HmoA
MFARKVSMTLKHNTAKDFTRKMDTDVIPLLRKQNGFQDEIMLTAKDGKHAVGISLWDTRENAEAYQRGSYPQVLKLIGELTDGAPQVESYEVSNSTFHKILAPART